MKVQDRKTTIIADGPPLDEEGLIRLLVDRFTDGDPKEWLWRLRERIWAEEAGHDQ